MSKRLAALLGTLALLVSVAVAAPASASATTVPADPAIRFDAYEFRPGTGELPDTPPGLTIAGYAQGQRGVYLVQFAGPVLEDWKAQVEAEGAELLDYIPDFAFQVRMNPAQASRVDALASVVWVGPYQPAFKVPTGDTAGLDEGLWRVSLFPGASDAQARQAIARSGAEVLRTGPTSIIVHADATQLATIANAVEVEWLEPFALPELHNEYGAGQIIGGANANTNGYDGAGQIVAVADTGLGGGTAATAHPDVPASRITAIENWPGVTDLCLSSISDDGAQDVSSGHGTHTALSVVSDGGLSGEGLGTAPAASLVFQAVENWATTSQFCQLFLGYPDAGYFLTGLTDLTGLYQQAYDHGARVHSNSWGSFNASACSQDYTGNAVITDDFINTHRDMTITFSAGNDGTDATGDGEVDTCSMGEPATAKNLIAVGASENDRQSDWACDTALAHTTCGAQGGQNDIFTYGAAWPGDYPAAPVASDPSAGNAEQIAAFSSRGPTTDGRVKPDVVAPGTWVLSGYSDLHQQGYDAAANPQDGAWQSDGWGYPRSEQYKYFGGTSMSNPIVAGGAAVVRDYYQTEFGHNASAALVKATLINSAVDLLDENNDGFDDNDYPIPNHHEGWGRVDLEAATDGSHQWLDEPEFAAPGFESEALATGGSNVSTFEVQSFGEPLRMTLVWTDAPGGSSGTTVDIVNDLDLQLTAPDGTVYRGNNFAGGWSTAGGTADRINTVENVYVPSADAGTWTLEVNGYNVPSGPQPYALVADFQSDTLPVVAVDNPLDGSTVSGPITVQIGATDLEDDPDGTNGDLFTEWKLDDGDWQPAPFNFDTDKYEASWDPAGVDEGSHAITARVTDSGGNQVEAVSNFTLSTCGTDAHGDDSTTATALTSGVAVSGQICPDTDVDWFSIDADADDTVSATLSYDSSAGDLNIALYGPDGDGGLTLLDSSAGSSSDDESVSTAASTAGTYYPVATGAALSGLVYDLIAVTDGAVPSVVVDAPTNNATVEAPALIEGSASDDVGVDAVLVEVYSRDTGAWWNGGGWQAGRTSFAASLDSPGGTATGWSVGFDPPALAAQPYWMTVRSFDAAGNASSYQYVNFSLSSADVVAPSVVVDAPTNNATVEAPALIEGSASDDVGVDAVLVEVYSRDTGAWWNGGGWQAGRTSFAASLDSPGGTATGWSVGFDPPALAAQPYWMTVRSFDAAGNASSYQYVNFSLSSADVVAPSVVVDAPTNNATVEAPALIEGSASDDVGVDAVLVEVYSRDTGAWWNGGGWQAGRTSFAASLDSPGGTATGWSVGFDPPALAAQPYWMTVRSFDAAGNASSYQYVNFSLSSADVVAPSVVVDAPTNNATVEAPALIEGSASDDVGVDAVLVEVYSRDTGAWWNGGGWQAGRTSFAASLDSPGGTATGWSVGFDPPALAAQPYWMTVRSFDAAGNASSYQYVNFTLE